MTETSLSAAASGVHIENDQFDGFARSVQERFDAIVGTGLPLFTVDAGDLYGLYLGSFLIAAERQHHTCHACRQFIERFGNLVSIDEDGSLISVMWDVTTAPPQFSDAVAQMAHAVRRGKVTGVFVPDQKVWGTPVTGEWHHLAIRPPAGMVNKDLLRSAFQVTAARKEDFRTLRHGLGDYAKPVVAAALNLLKSDAMFRSEKVLGPAQFLYDLHDKIEKANGARRDNIIWRAVATAPVGWSTPRSGMIGTLLDDLVLGSKPIEDVKRAFAAKMNPLQYQRPQAAPAAGNIKQAEKLVEQMGIAGSLRRRYARLDEVQTIWSPRSKPAAPAAGGVFSHLKAKDTVVSKAPVDTKPVPITFTKFARDVLPDVREIAVQMSGARNFTGILTAVDMDAPPILQWDSLEQRNPFSWYVYASGSTPSSWGLPTTGWVNCTGIILQPSMWFGDRFPHQGKSAVLMLDGAKDQNKATLCIFPEILRSELHQVRATIEAYSKAGTPEGGDHAEANGLRVGNGTIGANVIRVTNDLGTTLYTIDRWE